MNVVGTFFSPDEVREFIKVLDEAQIPYQLRTSTDEGGLETTELLADDAHYERACDVVENLQAAKAAASEQALHRKIRCAKCGSAAWERVEDESYSKLGLTVMRCKDCGCLFTRRGY